MLKVYLVFFNYCRLKGYSVSSVYKGEYKKILIRGMISSLLEVFSITCDNIVIEESNLKRFEAREILGEMYSISSSFESPKISSHESYFYVEFKDCKIFDGSVMGSQVYLSIKDSIIVGFTGSGIGRGVVVSNTRSYDSSTSVLYGITVEVEEKLYHNGKPCYSDFYITEDEDGNQVDDLTN